MGHLTPVRVFLCEEQPVIVEAMVRILGEAGDLALAGTASSIPAAMFATQGGNIDVLLIGQPPAARSVLPVLATVSQAPGSAHVVLWVAEIGEVDIFRALRMGARGIIRRTDPVADVLECLRVVGSGQTWLGKLSSGPVRVAPASSRISARERDVIELVCRGLANHQIAEALSIAPGTVKVHLTHIFEKTGLRDRFALAEHGQRLLRPRSDPSS